jgi:inosose dehydratase
VSARVGSAPDSWGVWFPSDPKQVDWPQFLDEVAQAGYEWIELGPYGYLPTDPARLRPEVDARGLRVAGGTVGGPLQHADALPGIREQALRVADLTAAMGGTTIVLLPGGYRGEGGAVVEPRNLEGDAWKILVDNTNALARAIVDRFPDLTIAFHPHGDSHVETPAQVEAFLADTDPAVIGLCLDTGHYAYRFGDNADLIRRHPTRIPYLHIKTVDGPMRQQANDQDLDFGTAVARGTFVEPPGGVIDFVALTRLLESLHFDGFAIVEQDLYPCAPDVPLPIAARTRRYLRDIGLG